MLSGDQPKCKPKPKPVQKKAETTKGKETEVIASDDKIHGLAIDKCKEKEVVASDANVHEPVADQDVHKDTLQVKTHTLPTVKLDISSTPEHVGPSLPDIQTETPVESSFTPTSSLDAISTSASAPTDTVPSQFAAAAASANKNPGRWLVKKVSTTGMCILEPCPCRALMYIFRRH